MPTQDEQELVGHGIGVYNAEKGQHQVGPRGYETPALDQSYKSYIGVKLIQAYSCHKSTPTGNVEGYNVKYADGYESWSPKEVFESAYLCIGRNDMAIMPNCIEDMISHVSSEQINPKTVLTKVELVTGFMQYETSSCVSPENYDERIGRDICMKNIKNEIWFAMGFVLQWARHGLKHKPKN